MNFSKRSLIFLWLLIVAFVSLTSISAQTSSVDLSFNALISEVGSGGFSNFVPQPDGKILSYGSFQIVNGVVKNNLVRLNLDGTPDNSFNCAACDFNISDAIVQTDGKIIVSGGLSASSNIASSARLRRFNPDGSLDTSFVAFGNTPLSPQVVVADVRAVQPDGKILVVLISVNSGSISFDLNRLNPNGTFDTAFTPVNVGGGRLNNTLPGKISVLPDGKILVSNTGSSSGNFSAYLRRYNTDGTLDTTFETPVFTGTAGASADSYRINDFTVLPDGSVIVVGSFNSVNAVSRMNIVKLQPAGNVDLTFVPRGVFQTGETGYQIDIYQNGKVLISTLSSTAPTNRFIRLNMDGSLDNSFTPPATPLLIYRFFIDSANNVLFFANFMENGITTGKFALLDTGGNLISTFTVDYRHGGSVTALAVQPDGKVIIVGSFQQVGGVSRQNAARLNRDGTLDQTFNTGTGFDGTVAKILVQPDGKILVGGSFFSFNGTPQAEIIRLNSDGSLDAGFNPNANGAVYSIDLQPDGKILIGGAFTSVGGQPRSGIARLNANGSLDGSFNVRLGSNPVTFFDVIVRRVIVQPDGNIIIGGIFTGVNGFNRTNLARLNNDGTTDATFNAVNISAVSSVELYPGNKYLVFYDHSPVRLNNDGTPDTAFQLSGFRINTFKLFTVQPDGSVIVSGSFTNNGSSLPSNLIRLRANGNLDASFLPNGANDVVNTIINQPDGNLLIGGSFTTVENTIRLGVARLNIAPVRTPSTQFDFDGDGRADISVYRPSNGTLYQLLSRNNSFQAGMLGISTDKSAYADYDGDGIADFALFRESSPGSNERAYFYILRSSGGFVDVQFGKPGDLPIPGDYDGDGKADVAVYRSAAAAGGQSYFFYRPSSVPGADFTAIPWGTLGDKPVMGDFDGDGKLDAAVFRPSNGFWYILQSSNNQVVQQQFGVATDIPTPADFDGDGKTNLGVFRPSNGYWYIARPTGAVQNFDAVQFGTTGDVPVAADFDGDGKTDIAVYRPSNGTWYLLKSAAGFTGIQFGASEDRPIPSAFIR